MWGDEAFTLQTISQSPARIIEILREDIHPPLYYLLAHWWNYLPIGSDPLLKLRALSAVIAISTTIFLDRGFLHSSSRALRNWFLLFWGLSPGLLLYGRMARSYSLQILLTAVTIWYLRKFAEKPVPGKSLLAFTLSLSALLYTHYLPGIAIWLGANLLLLMRLEKYGSSAWKTWVGCNAVVVSLYLPWLTTASGALQRWVHNQAYNLTGNVWTEQIAKLSYSVYSFAFGEVIPLWLLPCTLALALPCLWLFVSGARLRREWLLVGLFVSTIAFFGASRWTSTPAVPARLLFLLPWFLLAVSAGVIAKHRLGAALGLALLATNAAGIWSYFSTNDFLNTGYLIPSHRMAEQIALHSRPTDTVVWVDEVNLDGSALEYYLLPTFRVRELTSPESVEAAQAELKQRSIRHLWFVRSVHDISLSQVFDRLDSELVQEWPQHASYGYVELSATRAIILRTLAYLRHQDRKLLPYTYEVSEFWRPESR